MTIIEKNIPILRFPEFNDKWKERRIKEITQRYVNPVEVVSDTYYKEIGIRSHGKGLFYKNDILGEELGNKRVFWIKENAFILNIVFAWEQAISKTTEKEIGMIASHRFPMYLPRDNKSSVDFLLYYFLTPKGKSLLELASPGGAGRNKTLGQKEFDNLKLFVPVIQEQQKIAFFLNSIDKKITLLDRKKNLLEKYKKGIMQKIFSQEIRFKDENENDYPKWEEKTLNSFVAVEKGEQLNRVDLQKNGSYPAINGGIEPSGYTNSYNENENTVIISEGGNSCGYVNFIKTKFWCGGHCYTVKAKQANIDMKFIFQNLKFNQEKIMRLRVGSGLPNIQKKDLLKFKITIPISTDEQIKIANFLSAIDIKIENIKVEINTTKEYRKSLMQKMFI